MDEVHVSNIARSASWIGTTYNTTNSPSTFLTSGCEEHWMSFGTDETNESWSWSFNFPNSTGYYEFYSMGKKSGSTNETAPFTGDASCYYNPGPVISSPVPADGSEIDYDDATGLYNVTITDASTTFNWTIEIYYTGAGYFNNSGTDDTTGVKHCFYGFGYNYSYLVYVNVTNSFGLSADETYTFDIEPNCPPSVNWTYPANNSENNSLALIWECTFNDTTPGLPYWWEIDVYNNDTGIIFQNIDQLVLTTNTTANINLFGMNQSTWYRVEVKLYEPGADGCEECIGVDPSMPTSRNATFYFKTVNFTGYTWWDTDWKAKKLIKFDVNESEAEDLQVLINISKGPYGFPDNLATFPPTIYINSSNLGECRFVAQYWNTTDSTWGDTELYCYAELNSKTYDYITLPYEGAPVGADWIHVWVRLPPSNDTDKEYNRTAGEIWVYYKNLDHYPYNPISTTLELDSNGNDTFYWFRGFNEWIDESEWTQYTSGKHVWATLPIPDLNSTDKRLRFYQYMYQYHEAAGVDQYMDLFYVASTTGYNSAEKLSYYIKVDHATDKLYYYATGNHAGAPFTLMSAIMDWDAGGVYGFHDLIWYNDTEILINAYDYNGNFAGDADTSQTLDASLFKYIGFHMYTDVFAYSCQWGWDDTFLPSSLWQHVYDQWGDAEIYTSQLYCSIGKYIGREPTVTTTLLVELPYFILYTPTNGETDVELNPVLTGMVINGMGNALTQWWYYDPSLGWYNWLGQDNITNHSQVISLNTSLINDVYRQMINDGLWGSEYDTVYKWRITVTDGYTTFMQNYEFTTRFAIIANFTYVINGQQVIFTDTSTGAIDNMTTWYWDYGDGTTEDGVRNPVHYFYASANFTVTLIIEQITYHWSSEHNETLMMYVAPTVAPISILWQFDWGMFLPFVYILIILMLFLVLIFTIFRSAGKRYKPPRR
jgi:hypothetical protein